MNYYNKIHDFISYILSNKAFYSDVVMKHLL